MPAQSTFCVEHMVWWTSAQYPYRLCVTGPLHPAKLIDSLAMCCTLQVTFTCVAHNLCMCLLLCSSVAWGCVYSLMQMILVTVMYIQLLHRPFTCSHSGSPQNFMHSSSIIYLLPLTWDLDRSFSCQVLSSSRQWSRGARMTISDHVMYNFRTTILQLVWI